MGIYQKELFLKDLKDIPIFSGLCDSSLISLDERKQKKFYASGALIFSEGEYPQGIYCIGSGRVKLWSSSPRGQVFVFKFASSGDVFELKAFLLNRRYMLTAEAVQSTCVYFLERKTFLDFLEKNKSVYLNIAKELSKELYDIEGSFCNTVFRSSYLRVVELLLTLCDSWGEKTHEGILIDINLNQEGFAEMLGISRRTLTRALSRLTSLEFIVCKRRSIVVLNREGLENVLL